MDQNEKHERFLRLAAARTNQVLKALEVLGNCSTPVSYYYELDELGPIFTAIEEKVKETRTRLESRCRHKGPPFCLSDHTPEGPDSEGM